MARVAAFLTLLLAGLGHLHAGYRRRAAVFFVVDALWGALAVYVLIHVPRAGWNLVAAAAVYWPLRLWIARDAFRRARSPRARRWFNHWIVYLVCIVAFGFVHLLIVLHAGVEMFRLPTNAMAPTLIDGDRFLVDRWAGDPRRGDVVVYRSAGKGYVFRVVGLPGETIEAREARLLINGERIDEPYLNLEGVPQADFGPVLVPEDSYFVLGDRRNKSRDSRYQDPPFVRGEQIIGRAMTILWSFDKAKDEYRTERVGRLVR